MNYYLSEKGGGQSRKGGGSHDRVAGSHRPGENHDAVGDGRVLGHHEDVSPEVPLVDLFGCRSFAGGEVGRDVVLVGIHRAVGPHKVHP